MFCRRLRFALNCGILNQPCRASTQFGVPFSVQRGLIPTNIKMRHDVSLSDVTLFGTMSSRVMGGLDDSLVHRGDSRGDVDRLSS
jgi:hypothetical protein